MKSLVLIAGLVMAVPAVAKPKEKEPATGPAKDGTIKDSDAMKYVQARLEEQTGSKGWKITLGDLMGMAREFNATNGTRSEKGTVNVSKDYPNEGALRVYVQPRD